MMLAPRRYRRYRHSRRPTRRRLPARPRSFFKKASEVKKHYEFGDLLGTGNFAEV